MHSERSVALRVIAIVNPISGRRDVAAAVQSVAAELARADCALEVMTTAGPGDAHRIAAQAPDDTDAVLAVGGDGTVRQVAAGLVGRNIPLAVLPAGTENIVARHFRLPSDPAQVAQLILRGHRIQHDVGLLNGQAFLIIVGIGFDAEVVERLAAVRRGHIGYRTYVGPIWHTFWRHEFPPLQVTLDGQPFFEGRGMVFIGLEPRYALGLRILPRAVPDDGRLDVCAFPCDGRLSLLRHAARTVLGRHVGRGGVQYGQGRAVQVHSPACVPVQCDGDAADVLPLAAEIRPAALTLLVPGVCAPTNR
jgi:diacylglycerol kinase (ATP)